MLTEISLFQKEPWIAISGFLFLMWAITIWRLDYRIRETKKLKRYIVEELK